MQLICYIVIGHFWYYFTDSGLFGPGINAILGPTGSGKTTLVNWSGFFLIYLIVNVSYMLAYYWLFLKTCCSMFHVCACMRLCVDVLLLGKSCLSAFTFDANCKYYWQLSTLLCCKIPLNHTWNLCEICWRSILYVCPRDLEQSAQWSTVPNGHLSVQNRAQNYFV